MEPPKFQFSQTTLHTCEICGNKFSLTSELITHSRSHTLEKSFECTKCKKILFSEEELNAHYEDHSKIEILRLNNGKRVTRAAMPKENEGVIESNGKQADALPKTEPLNLCNSKKASRHSKDREIHHSIQRPYRKTSTPPSEHSQRSSDSEEYVRRPRVKRFRCPICGKRYVSILGLNRHKKSHPKLNNSKMGTHDNAEINRKVRRFRCSICKRRFLSLARLRAHRKVHEEPENSRNETTSGSSSTHTPKPSLYLNNEFLRCKFCNKGFLTSNILKENYYLTKGEKFDSCYQCGNKLTQEQDVSCRTESESERESKRIAFKAQLKTIVIEHFKNLSVINVCDEK